MTSNSTASGQLDTNGRELPSAAELEALSSFLRADVSDSENADVDLAEFLKRLDGAGDAAVQIEERLDVLLEQLDGMVEGLEASHASNHPVEGDSSKSASDSKESSTAENQ